MCFDQTAELIVQMGNTLLSHALQLRIVSVQVTCFPSFSLVLLRLKNVKILSMQL